MELRPEAGILGFLERHRGAVARRGLQGEGRCADALDMDPRVAGWPRFWSRRAPNGRVSVIGLGVVLVAMTLLGVVGSLRISEESRRASEKVSLADTYERARFAVASEESLERKYRLKPSPTVRRGFDDASRALGRSLRGAARRESPRARQQLRSVLSTHDGFRRAVADLFDAVDAGQTRRVLQIDASSELAFSSIEERVDVAASTHRVEAQRATASLRQNASRLRLIMPLGFLVGVGLLGLFAASLVAASRREAAREAELHAVTRTSNQDALTGLANRRKLNEDLARAYDPETASDDAVLVLCDLDGFKSYNDTFGHPAGDALLARLGRKLQHAVAHCGNAYRLGGDEFCVLADVQSDGVDDLRRRALEALHESGDGFEIACSCGLARLREETRDAEHALRLTDQRLYAAKAQSQHSAGRQTSDVLLLAMAERHPPLDNHNDDVTALAEQVARRLDGLADIEVARISRAAELHDVGKLAIPDCILTKPGALSEEEWAFVRRHTIIGERILSAAPALAASALLVRSSHERYDGAGYPDGLAGDAIPLGARIIAACDAYAAMTSGRPYKAAVGTDEAQAELRRCAGTQFDPTIVDTLCQVIREPLLQTA